jgi:hypothetical protein
MPSSSQDLVDIKRAEQEDVSILLYAKMPTGAFPSSNM